MAFFIITFLFIQGRFAESNALFSHSHSYTHLHLEASQYNHSLPDTVVELELSGGNEGGTSAAKCCCFTFPHPHSSWGLNRRPSGHRRASLTLSLGNHCCFFGFMCHWATLTGMEAHLKCCNKFSLYIHADKPILTVRVRVWPIVLIGNVIPCWFYTTSNLFSNIFKAKKCLPYTFNTYDRVIK